MLLLGKRSRGGEVGNLCGKNGCGGHQRGMTRGHIHNICIQLTKAALERVRTSRKLGGKPGPLGNWGNAK